VNLLPQVRSQLSAAATRQADEAEPRRSRLPRLAGGALLAAATTTALVIAVAFTALLHRGASAGAPPPGPQSYIDRAIATVAAQDPACNDALVEGATSQGTPSGLVAQLAIMRRPATSADIPVRQPPSAAFLNRLRKATNQRPGPQPSPRRSPAHRPSLLENLERSGTVYIRYVRRARTAYGQVFYLVPQIHGVRIRPPERCLSEQRSALAGFLASAPPATRSSARRAAEATLTQEREVVHPQEVLELIDTEPTGGGGGSCCSSAAQLAAGDGVGFTEGGGTGPVAGPSLMAFVVPDRAARIELDYSGRAGGMITVHTLPVGNVVVVKQPAGALYGFAHREVLRTADGRVLRTIVMP
jgi:hypothetical protein